MCSVQLGEREGVRKRRSARRGACLSLAEVSAALTTRSSPSLLLPSSAFFTFFLFCFSPLTGEQESSEPDWAELGGKSAAVYSQSLFALAGQSSRHTKNKTLYLAARRCVTGAGILSRSAKENPADSVLVSSCMSSTLNCFLRVFTHKTEFFTQETQSGSGSVGFQTAC